MKSQYPGIAGLAAQIELFGMGKREIEKKFTRSEILLMSWRSQEMSYLMKKQTDGIMSSAQQKAQRHRGKPLSGEIPEGLPDHFFNEEGEIDLRQVTGEEAYKYMSSIGIKLPVMPGRR